MTFIQYFIVSKLISFGPFYSVVLFRVYNNPERLIQGLLFDFEIEGSEGNLFTSIQSVEGHVS